MSDVRQEHMNLLGEEFGKVYHAVWTEWCSALMRYEEIRALFGTQEACDVLNRVAPRFFGDVQKLFWNDLILHVTRLTDKNRRSLRVQSLERFLKDEPTLLKRVRAHREAAVRAAAPVADWRNRRIAHRDRALAVDQTAEPLAKVDLDACKQVLDDIHAVLNAVYRDRHLMRNSLGNQIIYNPTSGDLLGRLEDLTDAVQFIASAVGWKGEDEDSLNGKIQDFLAKLGRSDPEDDWRVHKLLLAARV